MEYTKEQIKAAYALNLCTVSISQIIDYADVNIMEQEYEAILNNLNLEEMPKDDALLNILKQILDTVTFFRIQDGDKQFLEKDYQQKMKNAIWSAVPNIGMIVASGNPVVMATSLASQVGIGYMNYRKAKADIQLDNERQQWQLQKVAIEQFNGLRRELFDTAWRLSRDHNFPDEFRLTERQITQYNNILMDNDLLRKFERLNVIKENFLAYPPFWYHFGNTANSIANSELPLDESTRIKFREIAKEYFIQYRQSNQQGLLREDQVSASCALELVDLLDIQKDKALIEELLKEAIKFSGRANDVLQLAALTYLKINSPKEASDILIQLVNEQYNTVLNAQLLSSAYVANYLETGSSETLTKYNVLQARVGSDFLYPMPNEEITSLSDVENEFLLTQKNILSEKFKLVIDCFLEKYSVKFNKIIPAFSEKEASSDDYFSTSQEALEKRKEKAVKYFASKKNVEKYCGLLIDSDIRYEIIGVINEFFNSCLKLSFINKANKELLAKDIENAITAKQKFYAEIIRNIHEEKFMLTDIHHLLEVSLSDFLEVFLNDFYKFIDEYINTRKEMQDFTNAEEMLNSFCISEKLPEPAVLYGKGEGIIVKQPIKTSKRFPYYLLTGDKPKEKIKKVETHYSEMVELVKKAHNRIKKPNGKVEIYISGEPTVERYFRNDTKLRKDSQLISDTIAVFNDNETKLDFDMIFTVSGIVPVKLGLKKPLIPYKEVKWISGKHDYISIGGKYEKAGINSFELYTLIKELEVLAK